MHFVSYLTDVLTNFFALPPNFLLSRILSLRFGGNLSDFIWYITNKLTMNDFLYYPQLLGVLNF